jgi:hypothetical protein
MKVFGVEWNPAAVLLAAIIMIGIGIERGGLWILAGIGIFLASLLLVWIAAKKGIML